MQSQDHYSKVNGQIAYALQFMRYSSDKIFRLKVTKARQKIKSRSYHEFAHLHPKSLSEPSTNILHLMVSEIQPGQFSCQQMFLPSINCHIKFEPVRPCM